MLTSLNDLYIMRHVAQNIDDVDSIKQLINHPNKKV